MNLFVVPLAQWGTALYLNYQGCTCRAVTTSSALEKSLYHTNSSCFAEPISQFKSHIHMKYLERRMQSRGQRAWYPTSSLKVEWFRNKPSRVQPPQLEEKHFHLRDYLQNKCFKESATRHSNKSWLCWCFGWGWYVNFGKTQHMGSACYSRNAHF